MFSKHFRGQNSSYNGLVSTLHCKPLNYHQHDVRSTILSINRRSRAYRLIVPANTNTAQDSCFNSQKLFTQVSMSKYTTSMSTYVCTRCVHNLILINSTKRKSGKLITSDLIRGELDCQYLSPCYRV